jgi:Zn-finger domain-containing protein
VHGRVFVKRTVTLEGVGMVQSKKRTCIRQDNFKDWRNSARVNFACWVRTKIEICTTTDYNTVMNDLYTRKRETGKYACLTIRCNAPQQQQ